MPTFYSYNPDSKQGTNTQIVLGGERYKASDGRSVCAPSRVLKFNKGILHLSDDPSDAEAVAAIRKQAAQRGSGITEDGELYNSMVMTDRALAEHRERKIKIQAEEINRLKASLVEEPSGKRAKAS